MITVALIDDHLIVRSGFAQLLGLEPDLQVVAEFGSGREALAELPGRGVQVCICDISMPDISGLELLSQLPKGMATIMLSFFMTVRRWLSRRLTRGHAGSLQTL